MRVDPALTPFLAVAAAALIAPKAPVILRSEGDFRDLVSQYPDSPIELRPAPKGSPFAVRPPRQSGEALVVEIEPEVLTLVQNLTDAELAAEAKRLGIEP